MMRTIIIGGILSLTLSSLGAAAQTISSAGAKPVVKKPTPLSKEISGGFRLNTDGWSIFMDKGWIRSNEGKMHDQLYDSRIVQLEFIEHKDPKQIRRAVTDQTPQGGAEKSKPYVYGKINNFYALKVGYGFRKMIAGKPEPGTVSIHWVNEGGFSLGMLKPYYLDGYIPQDNFGTLVPATFKYSDSTKESFLTERYIRGSAGFWKGLDEIEFVPGLQAKTGLHFDFSANRKTLMAVEVGAGLEYYTKGIMIMANQDPRNVFLNLYASFQFGRRK